jgi:hypothetical protein
MPRVLPVRFAPPAPAEDAAMDSDPAAAAHEVRDSWLDSDELEALEEDRLSAAPGAGQVAAEPAQGSARGGAERDDRQEAADEDAEGATSPAEAKRDDSEDDADGSEAVDPEEDAVDEADEAEASEKGAAVNERARTRSSGAEREKARGGISLWQVAVVTGVLGVVFWGLYSASQSRRSSDDPARQPSARLAPPEAEPVAEQAQGSPEPAAAGPAPVAPPVGSPALPAAEGVNGPFDVETLERKQGALKVTAPEPASVYIRGMKKGEVGQWMAIKCGMQFVRLGQGDPPTWVSKGRTIVVPCGERLVEAFELEAP